MEIKEIFIAGMKVVYLILILIFILQVIMKLTGHSPTGIQILIILLTAFVSHYFMIHRKTIKEMKQDIKDNRDDIFGIKVGLGQIKEQIKQNTKNIGDIKLDLREIKTLIKAK